MPYTALHCPYKEIVMIHRLLHAVVHRFAPTYCAPCGWWHEPPIHG